MADTVANWNNNPGNLRPSGFTYPGQIGVDDNGFAVFKNKEAGHDALLHDVTTKIGRGLNSPEDFVDTYAPAGDNTEEARMHYKINMAKALGLSSTRAPFPENSHQKIANVIAKQEGFSEPEETKKPDAVPDTASDAPNPVPEASDTGTTIPEPAPGDKTLSPTALSVIGGGAGLVTGTAITGAQKGAHLAKGIYNYLSPVAKSTIPRVEPSMMGDTGVGSVNAGVGNTDAQIARIHQGGEGATEGTTGRARETGYKIQTSQEAAARKVAEETVELMNRAGISEMDAQKFLAKLPGLTASPAGVIYPKTPPSQGIGARIYSPTGSYVLGNGNVPTSPIPTSPIPTSPIPVGEGESILGKMAKYAGVAGSVLKPLAHIGISGLSGAVGANDLYNAEKDREKNGLTVNNGIDYLSGLGGIAGMIPTLPTQVAAGLMQTPAGIRWLMQHSDKFKPQPSAPNDNDFTGGP